MKTRKWAAAVMAAAALAFTAWTACAQAATKNLVIYCPHPIEFINPIVQQFEVETGVKVGVIAAGTGKFPYTLYRDDKNWVPPLFMDDYRNVNRKKHPFYQHTEADFF